MRPRRDGPSREGPPSDAAERYHDRVAHKYDAMYAGQAYWAFYDEITWDHLRGYLPRDGTVAVADLGCGTGKWGLRLARTGYPVTMVDISARMLDAARAAASEQLPASKQPRYIKADVTDLRELPQGHFGLVVAQGDPISHCGQPARAIKEIAAILKPGGVLVASVDNRAAGLAHYVQAGDIAALESFAADGRTHWLTAQVAERFSVKTFWPGELTDMLTRAGLIVRDVIGKTVLDLRRHGERLLAAAQADGALWRRLLNVERRLHREPSALGLAGHLQVAAVKPLTGQEPPAPIAADSEGPPLSDP